MNEELKFDTRLVRHHMRRNHLDRKEFDKFLGGLSDDSELGEETETRFSTSGKTEEGEE